MLGDITPYDLILVVLKHVWVLSKEIMNLPQKFFLSNNVKEEGNVLVVRKLAISTYHGVFMIVSMTMNSCSSGKFSLISNPSS